MEDISAFVQSLTLWMDNCVAWLRILCGETGFTSLQTALWAPVAAHDRLAWGLVAILCGVAGALRLRLLLAAKIDMRGLSMNLVFMGQVFGVLQFWVSAFQFYAMVIFSAGSLLMALLDRTNWDHLEGPAWGRLKMAFYILMHFDQAHPSATPETAVQNRRAVVK